MKISVITPSYNQGKFIQKCIDSVKAQKGITIEHIILDNCSTDETAGILKKYQENPGGVDVKVIVEKDKGQTAAINRGFLVATGDLVCWLNTDEYYKKNALKKVLDAFNENSSVDVLFGDCDFVDIDGTLIKRKREFGFYPSMLLYYGCYIPSCSTFISRRVIDSGLLLDPEFRVTMDYDWYVRVAKARYCFVHLPIVLASFTWQGKNISAVQVKRRKEERRMVQEANSGLRAPYLMRITFYECVRLYWIVYRNMKRMRNYCFN